MKLNNVAKMGIGIAGLGAGQLVYNVTKGIKMKDKITKESLMTEKNTQKKVGKVLADSVSGAVMIAAGAMVTKLAMDKARPVIALGVVVTNEDKEFMEEELEQYEQDEQDEQEEVAVMAEEIE